MPKGLLDKCLKRKNKKASPRKKSTIDGSLSVLEDSTMAILVNNSRSVVSEARAKLNWEKLRNTVHMVSTLGLLNELRQDTEPKVEDKSCKGRVRRFVKKTRNLWLEHYEAIRTIIIYLTGIYYAIIVPYRCAFRGYSPAWLIIDLTLDFSFIFFALSYYYHLYKKQRKTEVSLKFYKHMKFYSKIIIILISVPWEAIKNEWIIIKVLHCLTVQSFIHSTQHHIRTAPKSKLVAHWRLLGPLRSLTILLLITLHLCACFWIWIANAGERTDRWLYVWDPTHEKSAFDIYVQAYFFQTQTISTVGYGDTPAQDQEEYFIPMFLQLVSSYFYTKFLLLIKDAINKYEETTYCSQKTKEELMAWILQRQQGNASNKYTKKFDNNMETFLVQLKGVNMQELFKSNENFHALPYYLQRKVLGYCFRDTLETFAEFFNKLSTECVSELLLELKPVDLVGELFLSRTHCDGIYFIEKGSIDEILPYGNKSVALHLKGDVIGVYYVLFQKKSHRIFKSVGTSSGYFIPRGVFINILENYPKDLKALKNGFIAQIRMSAKKKARKNIDKLRTVIKLGGKKSLLNKLSEGTKISPNDIKKGLASTILSLSQKDEEKDGSILPLMQANSEVKRGSGPSKRNSLDPLFGSTMSLGQSPPYLFANSLLDVNDDDIQIAIPASPNANGGVMSSARSNNNNSESELPLLKGMPQCCQSFFEVAAGTSLALHAIQSANALINPGEMVGEVYLSMDLLPSSIIDQLGQAGPGKEKNQLMNSIAEHIGRNSVTENFVAEFNRGGSLDDIIDCMVFNYPIDNFFEQPSEIVPSIEKLLSSPLLDRKRDSSIIELSPVKSEEKNEEPKEHKDSKELDDVSTDRKFIELVPINKSYEGIKQGRLFNEFESEKVPKEPKELEINSFGREKEGCKEQQDEKEALIVRKNVLASTVPPNLAKRCAPVLNLKQSSETPRVEDHPTKEINVSNNAVVPGVRAIIGRRAAMRSLQLDKGSSTEGNNTGKPPLHPANGKPPLGPVDRKPVYNIRERHTVYQHPVHHPRPTALDEDEDEDVGVDEAEPESDNDDENLNSSFEVPVEGTSEEELILNTEYFTLEQMTQNLHSKASQLEMRFAKLSKKVREFTQETIHKFSHKPGQKPRIFKH